jgi:hypothetical protein
MDCSRTLTDPKIVVSEKGREFRLENPHRREILQVQVDGCLMVGEQERCDYLFEIPSPCRRVCYVELKGKNIEKAVQQIRSTLAYTQEKYSGYQKEAYIVSSRVPKSGPSIQQHQIKLKKQHKASLQIKNNTITLNIP